MELAIITTAVSRVDLHKKVFPQYLNFLEGVPCTWLINVDPIDTSSAENVSYLRSLIDASPTIDGIITQGEVGGTRSAFYNSVQRLALSSLFDSKQFDGVLWLEDDWMWSGEYTLSEILALEGSLPSMKYIQLVSRKDGNVLSFNPGIWSYDLFETHVRDKIRIPFSEINSNPERRCVYPQVPVNASISSFSNYSTFYDIGRQWTSQKNIYRTFAFTNPMWQ